MDHLRVFADSKIDQTPKTFLRLLRDRQAELAQCNRVVFQVKTPGRERSLIPVRVRISGINIPAHADPGRLENLVEGRNRGGFGLGEDRGRGCEQCGDGGSKKKFFHCWTFRWVSRPSLFSMARARFFLSFYQWVGPFDAARSKPSGTRMMRNQIATH